MSAEFTSQISSSPPDPSDSAAVVDFIVGLVKVYSGGSPHHDEAAMRALVERDVARTANVASCLTNHFVIDVGTPAPLGEIRAPTLVVHGDRDPVFPLEHGQALKDAVPGADLLVMEDTGHELPPPVWDVFVPAFLRHTGS
jgi:pimeloyl-ACP methyl ester carboxylesterase